MNKRTCSSISVKLNELYPTGLILGECKAIVGDLGLLVQWNNFINNTKEQKRFLPNEQISITEIRGEMLFLSGYIPIVSVHADRFKGFVRQYRKW